MKNVKEVSLMTAIKTPYLEDGEFDLGTYDRLVERQIANGVQGLIIGGTTGEGHLMNWDEHIMLIAHTVNCFSKYLFIVGNTGSNYTREAYKATKQGFNVGMDAALQVNPYYGKTSEAGLLAHFSKLLDLGPAIIYNVASRTAQDIPTHIIEELSRNDNLLGVKECSGSERIKYYEEKGISCWSGNDDQCHDSKHRCKSHGVISVAANVIPRTMRSLMDREDHEQNNKLKRFFDWLFCQPNPIPLNTVMSMMGLIKPVFRLPYVPLDQETRQKGRQLMNKLDLDEIQEDILELQEEDFILI